MGFIRRHQLSCLSNLTDLELVANGISDIEDRSFERLGCLRRLQLSFNNISVIREHTFSGLTALETLYLSENPLLNIAEKSFKPLVNLEELVLRTLGCPLTRITVSKLNLTHMFSSIPVNLSSLTVFMGPGPMSLAAGGVSTTRRPLTLRLVSSSVTITDCHVPLFRSITAFLVAGRAVRCGSEFIGEHMRNLETFEFLSDFPPHQADLSSLNALTRLRRLRLQNLDLVQQPGLGSLLHNLTSLRTLVLFNCSLGYLGASLARDLRHLTGLLLKAEGAVDVSVGFVQALPSLRYLLLQNLQLYCRCDNAWLADWARGSEQVEVCVSRPALEDLRCLRDDTDSPIFLRYAERECFSAVGCFFFTCSSLAVALLLLVPLLYRRAGPYLRSLYYILGGWASELGRGVPSYQYDAFVSYSGRDERWVVEQLLPGLERRGPPFLRLCLHSRDFQLGKDVVENITDSLYRSRRTLCLLSRHFLRSNWCSLELRLATYRLQVEHRDVLVLLFLEKIPSRLLTAHHRLARLVKTRTYIDWPQDPAQQEAFWERLWAKLAPASE
ncbi:toll-like receptor 13 [Sardina pilchardus]|uniref:toll-like receptor 13 n=1 Tax=Sardina pilchardus TaxID=27697 RepID=UPI002E0E933C